ncbi:Pentatricopeptide repeat-containing protein 2, mitochondrial [Saguinus oedipus]|uniref:Pentatricopeptide repeat-containing protein 2, mitochondrial n=1 Tax=Saguinus oedipus TaxID=9490 RepID=A0ABQ9WAB1_SAGOE|nr:Pentatricopeptide repeat-containing protein 2, mitochondrial [Saguinus oedipus]
MVRDSMAAALRPSSGVLLQALQISVYPGVGGSGSACYRCPLGGIGGLSPGKEERDGREGTKRYLLTENIVKLKEFQHKKVAVACNLPGTKGILDLFDQIQRQGRMIDCNDAEMILSLKNCLLLFGGLFCPLPIAWYLNMLSNS